MLEHPELSVVLYHDDFPFADREEVECAIRPVIEDTGLGECVDSGTMMCDRSYFDIACRVTDSSAAIHALRQKLREIGAGRSAEIRIGKARYAVYADDMQDLGPVTETAPDSGLVAMPTRESIMDALRKAGNVFRPK